MKSSVATSAIVILALATFCAASPSNSEYHSHQFKIDIAPEDAKYYLQGVQGFWIGYQEGFYKNKRELSEDCFNDATLESIMTIIGFLGHPDAKDVMPFFYSAVSVSKSFQTCAV